MNHPITFTPNELVQVVLAICGAIITISGALAIIVKAIEKAKAPNKRQDDRIEALEVDVEKINERLKLGNVRFQTDAEKVNALEMSMKETNKVIIESLQALTAHAIDGNNTDELKQSKKRLEQYLLDQIGKG